MVVFSEVIKTSRERHKLATYLRLKNSKKTTKYFTVYEKPESWTELARRGTLSNFSTSILSQNIKKIVLGTLINLFSKKSLTMPKKLKEGTESMLR